MYPLTLAATNANGTATQAFTLTVTRAPAIREIRNKRDRVGVPLRLMIRATGYPAPAVAESGSLPSGLTFTDNGNGTATIAGTPAAGRRRLPGHHHRGEQLRVSVQAGDDHRHATPLTKAAMPIEHHQRCWCASAPWIVL